MKSKVLGNTNLLPSPISDLESATLKLFSQSETVKNKKLDEPEVKDF